MNLDVLIHDSIALLFVDAKKHCTITEMSGAENCSLQKLRG